MTTMRTLSPLWPTGAESDNRVWARTTKVLATLWVALISLPDRGAAAIPDDLPCEFYRYPIF
jgi:hypothetical protein